ncbi:MAG: hypothetical protein CL501_00385 [Actinobacteria bacterium]|nr:hypothetical protein [Actinomycetota bacterium]|tara:strand:- start:12758 stop:13291 length:534 start_codon:yes stop_codon:yes gene_type:complete
MTESHFGSLKHLIARFACSLFPSKGTSETDKFLALLNPGEMSLFDAQRQFDKRHSFRSVKKLHTLLETPDPDIVIACGLHDVGKLQSGFGIFGRVFATCVSAIVGLHRVDVWSRNGSNSVTHRIATYVQHPEIGAGLLAEAGSNAIAIVWARDHHKRLDESTLDPSLFMTLSKADRR